MSIVYCIDQERGLAVVLWDGRVTGGEFLAHARRLLADTEWPPGEGRHFADLRSAIVDQSVDDAVLKEAADYLERIRRSGVSEWLSWPGTHSYKRLWTRS